jgi:hypothetical protein
VCGGDRPRADARPRHCRRLPRARPREPVARAMIEDCSPALARARGSGERAPRRSEMRRRFGRGRRDHSDGEGAGTDRRRAVPRDHCRARDRRRAARADQARWRSRGFAVLGAARTHRPPLRWLLADAAPTPRSRCSRSRRAGAAGEPDASLFAVAPGWTGADRRGWRSSPAPAARGGRGARSPPAGCGGARAREPAVPSALLAGRLVGASDAFSARSRARGSRRAYAGSCAARRPRGAVLLARPPPLAEPGAVRLQGSSPARRCSSPRRGSPPLWIDSRDCSEL